MQLNWADYPTRQTNHQKNVNYGRPTQGICVVFFADMVIIDASALSSANYQGFCRKAVQDPGFFFRYEHD